MQMPSLETVASFTPDQLQLVGGLVMTFGVSFITFVWKTAEWKARVDKDLDNFGKILGTEKGIANAKKREEKRR